MDELKPCPFCGSTDLYKGTSEKGDMICCSLCETTGPIAFEEENGGSAPEELWNEQLSDTALTARIAELEAENKRLMEIVKNDIAIFNDPSAIQLNIKRFNSVEQQKQIAMSLLGDDDIEAIREYPYLKKGG